MPGGDLIWRRSTPVSVFLEVGKSELGKRLPRVDNVPRLLSIQCTRHTGTFNATHSEVRGEIELSKELEKTEQRKS